ncbi:sigma-70 family RNA polymerase sigma factor [Paractinoplanes hotanensis]|uniref:Sigma-70 family RNA polymerase sigma factor n=1 Tax=Paractinoplanes hotanensis TaxID=2906497 RepID=A0ABT0XYM2_9ACTN|nr:sigma-70 family RNA polymerase sigma factor [Actinoplanes hotanensis]MCM4078893.1 sigma-70 family RNA polymerase sigma factor [Actinoplanes hotanensis]
MSEDVLELAGPAFRATAAQQAGEYRASCRVKGSRLASPRSNTPPSPEHLSDFLRVRSRLLRIAQRVIGREAGAEDIVQDAWLRWNRTDRSVVRNVPAFLCRTTTMLAINATQTAHVRHQSLSAPWAMDRPDPADGPATVVERAEEVRAAMLLLVQRLTPRERCAYVLREAFDYPHRQIADVLGMTEVNARQLIRRARIRLRAGRDRPASSAEQLRLLGAFLEVAGTGDPAALADLARDSP